MESVTKNRGEGVEDGSETSNDGLHTGALRRGQEAEPEVADMERWQSPQELGHTREPTKAQYAH